MSHKFSLDLPSFSASPSFPALPTYSRTRPAHIGMSVDDNSPVRALVLPQSPNRTPTPEQQAMRPSWNRIQSTSSRRGQSPYVGEELSYREQIISSAFTVRTKLLQTFRKMTVLQRVLAAVAMVVAGTLGILFLVFNERIFGWLAPAAQRWRDINFGWMILWALTFTSAFPPIIGYSTTVTISGFVYGFPNGWFIVASATIAGSLASFIASRTILSGYVHRLVGKDKRFNALALTLQHDGLKILCMIRFCPLPYSLSNAAMSTFHTVHPLSFALATALTTPKLMIHVFIGSRLASIGENGGKMDTGTKAINYASIAFGMILGASVGWIIYKRTVARAQELELEEAETLRQGRVNEDDYSDGADDANRTDAGTLMGDDDISLWDNDEGAYQDEFPDREQHVFSGGDLDEEAAIGGQGGKKVKPPMLGK